MVTIVGAAIFDGSGRVLAAERSGPGPMAGGWEFPGGKVEPGESDSDALIRECREELGIHIELGDRLGPEIQLSGGLAVLRVWTARLAAGQPQPLEHASLRWLTAEELYDVGWLPADLPVVEELRRMLAARTGGMGSRTAEGMGEGIAEGMAEGMGGGMAEGVAEGIAEG